MKLTNGQVQSKKREAASLLRLETAAEGVGTTLFFVVGCLSLQHRCINIPGVGYKCGGRNQCWYPKCDACALQKISPPPLAHQCIVILNFRAQNVPPLGC